MPSAPVVCWQQRSTPSAGKVTNCQIGVSLEIATATQHVPIDFELYLPESWANDSERRAQARVPDDKQFQTKIELALGMIERAKRNDIPGEVVLADSGYGESSEFRSRVRSVGFDYAVGIHGTTKVRRIRANGKLGKPMAGRQRPGQNHCASQAPQSLLA